MSGENILLRSLEDDEAVFGASVATFSPAIIEIYGELGLDFAWLDFEHAGPSPYDSTVFEEFTRAADVANIELLVRLPSGEPPLVRKVLDAGVRTILIPRVETAAEVERAVAAARFSHGNEIGDRGIGVGRTSQWGGSLNDLVEREDDNILIGTMIENSDAVQNVEDILSVPDLGFAFIGPADLSVSLGHPLEKTHPDVQTAIETVRKACIDTGVPVGCIQNDVSAATKAIENGYRILRIGDEISAVREVLSGRFKRIRS